MAPTPSLRGPSGAVQDRMIGRLLGGRYRVMSRLGEGGMGTVYLCEHAVLGRRYAVKVLRAELSRDPELEERFRNEAIAASRIGGDNVVDVVDFGTEDDGALYYVMEALDGRSLGTILVEDGPFDVDRALALLEQVARALGAAHARGVIHRDVKPDNVFVVKRPDGTERAKVIDFGISQVTPEAGRDRITRAGSIIGTPEYMAPEQAAGDPVDQRADVYALGVLAYELLTGTLPIVALTPVATLVAHQTRAPVPPSRRRPAIPPEVDRLILRALAKRPEDRPASMEAFSAALAAIRGTAEAQAPAPSQGGGTLIRQRIATVALPDGARLTRRSVRLRLAALLVGGALGAGAVVGAVGWWWTRGRRGTSATAASAEPAKVSSTTTTTSTKGTATVPPTATATATVPPTPTPIHKPGRRVTRAVPAKPAAPSPPPAEPDGLGVLKDPYQ